MNDGPVTRLPLVADTRRERVVRTLEHLLERAQRGEIEDVSVMFVCRDSVGERKVSLDGTMEDGVEELGMLEVAKHGLLEKMLSRG